MGDAAFSPTIRRWVLLVLKVVFSAAMLWLIASRVLQQQGFGELRRQLDGLGWGWIAAAFATQVLAIACSVERWRRLLAGQGIVLPRRTLLGSFLIGRFWGAFTPGGFTGHGGWRIYDIAQRTGKTARAAATIGVEMILGQLAFGVVVMLGSVFGRRFLGVAGVIAVNLGFAGIIAVGLLFLGRPVLFRRLAQRLPAAVATRVQGLVDAVCAYDGKLALLGGAVLLGVGTHVAHNLLYVCTARALGTELGVGEVFFASSLQIMATLLPASINGIGLREAAAVSLYTRVGVPAAQALLIPVLGFAVEMVVSAIGGVVFLLRRRRSVETELERDGSVSASTNTPSTPLLGATLPAALRHGWRHGSGIGALAGAVVGLVEAAVILLSAHTALSLQLFAIAVVAYGVCGALLGILAAACISWWTQPDEPSPGSIGAAVLGVLAFALTLFRVRRDYWDEQLRWASVDGLGTLFLVASAAVAVALSWGWLLRQVGTRSAGAWLRRPWGGWAVTAGLAAALSLGAAVQARWQPPATPRASPSTHLNAAKGSQRQGDSPSRVGGAHPPTTASPNAAPSDAVSPDTAMPKVGNLLFLVVDTLRADHLPAYGYARGKTPHLDAFDADAIRFQHAFANASWTRPSFASLLTGRLPSSHRVMHKADALDSSLVTLPEALQQRGWATAGFVTNFNVAPYFNFQQGFDEYHYLEPDFVLGADDAAAKLLLVQALRQRIETWRAATDRVAPGTAYQDAATVHRSVFGWLDRAPAAPWMLFVAYMDPHDPYFTHPYDGRGYARAAHPRPQAHEADHLRRLYDGELTYWDQQFGRLVAELRRRNLYNQTTIVITADHGEEFFDHGGYWHGTTLYDEQLHVPLWIKLPGGERGGSVVRHWVQSIDLMPTLLQLARVQVPPGVQGGDLFHGTDTVYAEESHEGNVLEALRRRQGGEEHKVIRANPGNPRRLPPTELFRTDLDPGEQQDLSQTSATALRAALGELQQAQRDAQQGRRHGNPRRQVVDLKHDADALERLKRLGYTDP